MAHDSKISIALVGGGTIAPLHAQYILTSPTCELTAIIDPFPPGRELAVKLSVLHFDSVSALLASDCKKPDTYIVCVPSSLHVSVATEIIDRARPRAILVEKPFSTDARSGAELLDTARRSGCTILVGHHRRFHPSLSAAKEVIATGRIGKVTAISGLWTAKKNDGYFSTAKWRGSRSAGGGPIWTNLVHDIDALHYLTGSVIVRIWATATPSRRAHEGIAEADVVEEGAAIMIQLANGVVGTFIICDNVSSPYDWEHATGDNPMYPQAQVPVDAYRIFGTKGTLSEPDGTLWTYEPGEAEKRGLEVGWNIPMLHEHLSVTDGIPFQRQTEHLARVVRGEETPVCSGEDGLAAVKVCEAIIEALRRRDGIPISVE